MLMFILVYLNCPIIFYFVIKHVPPPPFPLKNSNFGNHTENYPKLGLGPISISQFRERKVLPLRC